MDMRKLIDVIVEGPQGLAQKEPFIALVENYGIFVSINMVHLQQDARDQKSSDALEEMLKIMRQPYLSGKKIWEIDHATLKKNKDAVLRHIHDMMNFLIARMKKYLTDEGFDRRRARINKILTMYNDCVGQ